MTTKSHNAKKPKLAGHHLGNSNNQIPSILASSDSSVSNGGEGSTPEKHKMSFAQHQHELQIERTASPLPLQDAPTHHLKSDAQQHQQKSNSHK
jgi:hypothetical protein